MSLKNVTDDIGNVLTKVLSYLQAERSRLISDIEKMDSDELQSASFVRNPEFDNILSRLVKMPMGLLASETDPVNENNEPSMLTGSNPPVSVQESKHNPYLAKDVSKPSPLPQTWFPQIETKNDANPRRRKFESSPYADMKVLMTITDNKIAITKPIAIAAMPERACFAVLHSSNRLSLLSYRGEIITAFTLGDSGLESGGPTWMHLDPNKVDRFVILNRGHVKTVDLTGESAVVKTRIGHLQSAFGLALHKSKALLYVCEAGTICCFSMADWSLLGRYTITLVRENKPLLLGIHEDILFYRTKGGRAIYSVEICEDGSLVISDSRLVDESFDFVQGLNFDPEGNLLVIDKVKTFIQVLSAAGQHAGVFIPPRNFGCFAPTSLAVMTASQCGFNVFDKQSLCSRLIAIADYLSNRIVFVAAAPFEND